MKQQKRSSAALDAQARCRSRFLGNEAVPTRTTWCSLLSRSVQSSETHRRFSIPLNEYRQSNQTQTSNAHNTTDAMATLANTSPTPQFPPSSANDSAHNYPLST